jgi:hypothetical protein
VELTLKAVMAQNARLLASRKRASPGVTPARPSTGDGTRAPIYKDPEEYARKVLGVRLMEVQAQALRHLLIPPNVVNMPSGNNWGKTFLAAVAVSWWYDSFPQGVVYCLGPKKEHVVNVLWGQLRVLRAGIPTPWTGPKAPEIYGGPDHFAVGMTASRGEGFRGRHLGRKLFLFDEATADEMNRYLEELPTMLDVEQGDAAGFFYNPTRLTSRMYQIDTRGQAAEGGEVHFHRFRLNCLEHPNLRSQLNGGPILYRAAVNLTMVTDWVKKECEPVAPGDELSTDVEWPRAGCPSCRGEGGRCEGCPRCKGVGHVGLGKFVRPGAWFQARCLGLWPTSGSGVWSDALWEACQKGAIAFDTRTLPQLGIDCAQGKGEDHSSQYGRWGNVCLFGESSATVDAKGICRNVRTNCERLAGLYNSRLQPNAKKLDPRRIPVKIDDDGTGRAVWSFLVAEGYQVSPVGAATKAVLSHLYPRKRDELWFEVADRAKKGGVRILPAGVLPGFGMDRETQLRLRLQLMAPEWQLRQGKRQVEPKEDTREKIGRSPDEADAFNLAYYDPPPGVPEAVEPQRQAPRSDKPYWQR